MTVTSVPSSSSSADLRPNLSTTRWVIWLSTSDLSRRAFSRTAGAMWKTISLSLFLSARGALRTVEFLHELPQRIGEGTRVAGDRPLVADRPVLAGDLQRHLDRAVGAFRPRDNALEAQAGAVGDYPADGLVIL